jgi:hypothetical protein
MPIELVIAFLSEYRCSHVKLVQLLAVSLIGRIVASCEGTRNWRPVGSRQPVCLSLIVRYPLRRYHEPLFS